MATAVTADTYLQQIHTARTQLLECFRRAHELLTEREAHLLRQIETIQNDYETETNSQQEELQGLEASKQSLKNNLRDNDLLNEALAAINRKIQRILILSSGTARTIKFQWDTEFDRNIQHAGEIVTTTPQPADFPATPPPANLSPVTHQPANLSPVTHQPTDLILVIHQPADLTPDQPADLTSVIHQPAELSPIILQPADYYIPDYKNKITPVIACCKHKKGTAPGELHWPQGIAVEPQSGRIYIADYGNDRVQVFTPDGEYSFMFSKNMNRPCGICIDNDTVYVSQCRGDCITAYKLDGAHINKVGSKGTKNGQFDSPTGIAVSPATGHLYVCDSYNNRVQIFDKDLRFHAKLSNKVIYPRNIKLTNELVIILNEDNPCMHIFSITDHSLINSVISHGAGGLINDSIFFTMDAELNLLLTDCNMHCIKIFSLTGKFIAEIGKKGEAAGEFIQPTGIAIDGQNRIIVVSQNRNASLQIFISNR